MAKSKKQWYAVCVETPHEGRVKKDLKRQAKIDDLDHLIGRIVSPTEKIEEKRNTAKGTKTVTKYEKKLPGYLLVFCDITDDVLYLFKETKGVFGFLPLDAKPIAIPGPDMKFVLDLDKRLNDLEKKDRKVVLNFGVGDEVEVARGSFKGCVGKVKVIGGPENDPAITVTIQVWGRDTDIPNLQHTQVKKV